MEKVVEGLKEILISSNAWMFFLFLVFVVFILIKMSKAGLISFKGKGLRIGSDEKELTIIRNQIQWVHLYIMSRKGKLINEDSSEFTKVICENILEKVYDKVIEWITFNHINSSNTYVEIKQSEIKCLVYSLVVSESFKTPEFEQRMNGWVKEVILNLITIRKEYSQQ